VRISIINWNCFETFKTANIIYITLISISSFWYPDAFLLLHIMKVRVKERSRPRIWLESQRTVKQRKWRRAKVRWIVSIWRVPAILFALYLYVDSISNTPLKWYSSPTGVTPQEETASGKRTRRSAKEGENVWGCVCWIYERYLSLTQIQAAEQQLTFALMPLTLKRTRSLRRNRRAWRLLRQRHPDHLKVNQRNYLFFLYSVIYNT
jgi:hypothetical protein